MDKLIRGQKLQIPNLSIKLNILVNISKSVEVDISCFGVDKKNKLSDERYFIFYNQPKSPEGAIKKIYDENTREENFSIELNSLPNNINKLVFTAAIDGNAVMSQIEESYIIFWDSLKFDFKGSDFKQEKAVILAEIYKKNDIWRLSIVTRGFDGGLNSLLEYFGGVEDTGPKEALNETKEPYNRINDEFENQLKQLSTRILNAKKQIQNEEATKVAFIMPFFQILGYDVFNPSEFVPEYSISYGVKKEARADYAIFLNEQPMIIIEAKSCTESIDTYTSQLFQYYTATSAKFAILTNGIIYQFYTDLEKEHIMDKTPFLEVNLLNLRDSAINELKKFSKSNFNIGKIFSTASELKYTNNIINLLSDEYLNPSDDFIRFIINNKIYTGVKTQSIIDKFRPIIKNSFHQFFNEMINERLKIALEDEKSKTISQSLKTDIENEADMTTEIYSTTKNKLGIVDEKLQSFYVIKSMLFGIVQLEKIIYKDTEAYLGILYENNRNKWICRLKIGATKKSLIFPDRIVKEIKYFETIDELFNFKHELIESAQRFV